MGLAKPGKTRGLMGMDPGLTHHDAVGKVLGRFWNQTEPFLLSEHSALAGYPDQFLKLLSSGWSVISQQIRIEIFIALAILGILIKIE